ncbi:MAG TPA: efflux RND transporter periplasmic adaptor subunit [Alphaproteobacteria bacterium]|nr:efflux RND transporter periplasmic adaptor subunit [Alphaproteobacteria bacterium]
MNEQVGTRPLLRQASPPQSRDEPSVRRFWASIPRRWLAITLLLSLAASGSIIWWSMRRAAVVHYTTVSVARGDITRTVTATGTVNPELTIIVGSYVSGVIQKLYCDYNTQVTVGQVCAKIDPRPYQTVVDQDEANLAVAKAQLEKDKANLAYTKLGYERYRALAAHKFASQDAADNAKNLYDQAQAQIGLDQATIEQRQAELDAAQVNLDYTDITSPVNGTVVSRNVTQGQTVAASFQTPTLFLIATDLTRMQVDTNVSESDIGSLREGDRASFTVDAFPRRVFEGTVTQVRQSPQTVQNVVTFDAVVSVNNRDLALKPGMTASTRIIVDRRSNVLRVPNQALRYTPGGLAIGVATEVPSGGISMSVGSESRLWVLRDGKAVSIPVVLGLDDENFTEIVKGDLRADDKVIVAEEGSPANGQSRPSQPRP